MLDAKFKNIWWRNFWDYRTPVNCVNSGCCSNGQILMPKIFKTLILVNCREPRSKIRHQGFHPFAFGPRFPADPLIGGIQFKLGKFKDEFTDKIQLLKCQNTLMNESLMSTLKFPWQQLCMNEFECRRFLYSKKRVSTRRKILSSRVWCRWKYIFIYERLKFLSTSVTSAINRYREFPGGFRHCRTLPRRNRLVNE